MKSQYENEDGTHHKEAININGQDIAIGNWLEMLRHEPIEYLIIFALYGNGCQIIYNNAGEQFSYSFDINEIISQIAYISRFGPRLYVVHNHPYIYEAATSKADLEARELINYEVNIIVSEARAMRIYRSVELVDFAIVTEFDYWSYK